MGRSPGNVRKNITLFLSSEEAKVLKKDIMKLGLTAAAIAAIAAQTLHAGAEHGDSHDDSAHQDHVSHESHTDAAAHTDGHVNSGNHFSHSDEAFDTGGLGSHVSHADEVFHGDGHENHQNHVSHADGAGHGDGHENHEDHASHKDDEQGRPARHNQHGAHSNSSGGKHYSGAAPYDEARRRGGHSSYRR